MLLSTSSTNHAKRRDARAFHAMTLAASGCVVWLVASLTVCKAPHPNPHRYAPTTDSVDPTQEQLLA